MTEPNELRDRLIQLSDEERFKYLDRLRTEPGHKEILDLVRWGLEELEKATVGMMCSLGGQAGANNAEIALLCAGRTQAIELFRGLVLRASSPESED